MDLPDVDNPEEFRCISLCSGYAGLELGIRRAVPALRTVCYVEVETFACANLVAKIEKGELDAAPIWTDLKTFDGRPFRKRVHIITAGYPCQGESVAGKRQGKADPRWLWPYIERIIETVEPLWFFGENVSGHLTLGFPTVYRSLRNLGYKVEAGLFTAAEVGAPHRRERLFILAHRTGSRCEDVQIQQKREPTFRNGYGSLDDARGTEPRKLSGCQRQEDSQIRSASDELADTECTEQGQRTLEETSSEIGRDRFAINRWPSRPGQPQYEWEEPRVVANTKQRCRRRQDGNSQRLQCSPKTKRPDEGQAQSRLGRAANGTSSRVDRLRLLGNGVVPQQAEKAFRELIKLFLRGKDVNKQEKGNRFSQTCG